MDQYLLSLYIHFRKNALHLLLGKITIFLKIKSIFSSFFCEKSEEFHFFLMTVSRILEFLFLERLSDRQISFLP